MVVLVGSSIVFTSISLQAANNTVQSSLDFNGKNNSVDNIVPNSQRFQEVQILIYILEALGVAIIVLFVVLQEFSTLSLKELYHSVVNQTNRFAVI